MGKFSFCGINLGRDFMMKNDDDDDDERNAGPETPPVENRCVGL